MSQVTKAALGDVARILHEAGWDEESKSAQSSRTGQSASAILTELQNHRQELQRLGVRRIGLFGSAVRGEATEASDLDFLVDLDVKSFDAYMDAKEYLERLFGRKVDLVLTDNLKPRLRPAILNEAVYASGF